MLNDKKTKITFHSGVLTIGGTIIEVKYEDSHIFFDFEANTIRLLRCNLQIYKDY